MLSTIIKYRTLLTVAFVFVMGVVLVPAAHAGNVFGLEYGTATGLGTRDLRETVSRIINVALSLLGIVALVIILIGGFKWMTAGGSEEKVEEARKMIFSGIIGLAIILSSFAIARFVLNQLARATGVVGQEGETTQF